MAEFSAAEADNFRERAKALRDVSLAAILTDGFIASHTDFASLDELTDTSGISSLAEIETEGFAQFIRDRTRFETWDELVQEAFVDYVKNHVD